MRVHKKWADIQDVIDQKAFKNATSKPATSSSATSEKLLGRSTARVWGSGGALDKIIRKAYRDGKKKLDTHSFKNAEEKAEYMQFVQELTREEMEMVSQAELK